MASPSNTLVSGANGVQTPALVAESGNLFLGDITTAESAEVNRSEPEDVDRTPRSAATRRYSRDLILKIRDSHLVKNSPISLESEIFRELQVNGATAPPPNPSSKPPATNNQAANANEPPNAWKEDGWRPNRYKGAQEGAAIAPPAQMGPIRSRLVDDGSLGGSPEKEKLQGNQPRGPGWRRNGPDWRGANDNEHPHDGWRPSNTRGAPNREENDRERERWSGAGKDDTWRPPPPGLTRAGQPVRGPPGLSSSSSVDQYERPWGAGRGRLADGERRVAGKPRDPPGVLPPREQSRDPNSRPQLPEGWNKPRDPDARPIDGDWRTGKGKEWEDKSPAKKESAPPSRGERPATEGPIDRRGGPAWMRDEGSDAPNADGLTLAERRRADFEAERKAMQEERSKAGKGQGQAQNTNLDLITDDELEAMRQEALEEEAAAEVTAQPAQAPAPSKPPGFNVDSLFAESGNNIPNGGSGLPGRPESRQSDAEMSSRFSRWFRMEGAASEAPPSSNPAVLGETGSFSAALPAVPDRLPSQGVDTNMLQSIFSPQPPANESQASMLAQLQAGLQGRGELLTSSGSLPSNPVKHRTLSDLEGMRLDQRLLSPRGSQDPQLGKPQQLLGANSIPSSNSLLSLLHGQNLQNPQRATVEPSLANSASSVGVQQRHQNLLEGLRLGNAQAPNQLSASLLEQLQRPGSVQGEPQKQQFAGLQQMQQNPAAQNRSAGIDLTSHPLLSAFSAQMPREGSGAAKPLSDDLFNFAQRDQINRLTQPGLAQQQPQHLGLGQGERTQNLNLGGQQQNALQALLQSQQLSQLRNQTGLGAQAPAYSSAGFNYSQAGGMRLGGQMLSSQGFGSQSIPGSQAGYGSRGLDSYEARALAHYQEQQRQLQAAQQQQQQQQQQALQQRLLQLQLAQQQQQQQQQQAAQQRVAQAFLAQQQHQQQGLNYAGLGSQQLNQTEALLRRQQQMQFRALNLGGGGGGGGTISGGGGSGSGGGINPDGQTLARLLASHGSLNKLGGGGSLQ